LGFNWTSHLRAAVGDWEGASAALDALEAIDPVSATLGRARLALLPGSSAGDEQLRARYDELASLEIEPPDVVPGPYALLSANEEIKPALRLYSMALLADRLGRPHEVEELAARMEQFEYREESQWLIEDLVLGLRARVARAAGRPEEALAMLETMTMRSWHGLTLVSAYHSRVHERALKIDLLLELGREDQARRWIDHIAQVSPFELPYVR
jgi:hypothetical protein